MNKRSKEFEFLSYQFLLAMNDIGRLGYEKYGEESFHILSQKGIERTGLERVYSKQIAEHAAQHFKEYLEGTPHDKFNTLIHQLAAVAFNAMMEAYFLSKDNK